MEDEKIAEIKPLVRSILLALGRRASKIDFMKEYYSIEGEKFERLLKTLNLSFYEFMKLMPDVVRVQKIGEDVYVERVSDKKTQHMDHLTIERRRKGIRSALNRPLFNSYSLANLPKFTIPLRFPRPRERINAAPSPAHRYQQPPSTTRFATPVNYYQAPAPKPAYNQQPTKSQLPLMPEMKTFVYKGADEKPTNTNDKASGKLNVQTSSIVTSLSSAKQNQFIPTQARFRHLPPMPVMKTFVFKNAEEAVPQREERKPNDKQSSSIFFINNAKKIEFSPPRLAPLKTPLSRNCFNSSIELPVTNPTSLNRYKLLEEKQKEEEAALKSQGRIINLSSSPSRFSPFKLPSSLSNKNSATRSLTINGNGGNEYKKTSPLASQDFRAGFFSKLLEKHTKPLEVKKYSCEEVNFTKNPQREETKINGFSPSESLNESRNSNSKTAELSFPEPAISKKSVQTNPFLVEDEETNTQPIIPTNPTCDDLLAKYITTPCVISCPGIKIVKIQSFFELEITAVVDPSKFVFKFHRESFRALSEEMNLHYNNLDGDLNLIPKKVQPKMTFATFHDGNWLRVEIIEVAISVASALFVDLGYVRKVELKNLRYLYKTFAEPCRKSATGCLFGIKPKDDAEKWSSAAKMSFRSKTQNMKMFGSVKGKEQKHFVLTLIDHQRASVANSMVLEGAAVTIAVNNSINARLV